MTDEPEWFERLLDLQLQVNRQTLDALRRDGIAEDALVRLDFLYLAPGEAEARGVEAFLRAETDYEVQAFERRENMDANSPWLVVGMTQATTLTLELLDAWTEWMVAAGVEKGPCAFDGWGAQLPGPA